MTPATANQAGTVVDPAAISAANFEAGFTSVIGSGSGGDGVTLSLLDASSVTATSVGNHGNGVGATGLAGIYVILNTYTGGKVASSVSIGTNPTSGTAPKLLYNTTSVPSLLGTHQVWVTVYNGVLTVAVDGDPGAPRCGHPADQRAPGLHRRHRGDHGRAVGEQRDDAALNAVIGTLRSVPITAASPAANAVLLRKEGRAAYLTLNRPKAINALTRDMVLRVRAALDEWQQDASVDAVVIAGAGDRGLCAGGDIRAVREAVITGHPWQAAEFWRDEYRLNLAIARYPKPYVAIMDGIVMGGGVGISAHGPVRIVTERSRVAMPETGIGFIPDVGGTYLLSRAPGELGTHLALTGTAIPAADAILCGLADHFVPSAATPTHFTAALATEDPSAALKTFAAPVPDATNSRRTAPGSTSATPPTP